MATCKNCGVKFEGSYCPACGQKNNSGRITIRDMGRDALHYIFDYDTPLFRTFRELFVSPGRLVKKYIAGERKKYVHPLRYFIIVLAIYLVVKQLLAFDPVQIFYEAAGMEPYSREDRKTSNFFAQHIDYFFPVFITTLALLSRLVFRKSGIYFAEYLGFSLYVISQYLFLSLCTVILSVISPVFFLLNYLFVLLYPLYVLVVFHTGNLFFRILKSTFVALIAWLLYVFLSTIISAFIISIFNL